MSPVKFRAFRLDPSPPALPDWVLQQIADAKERPSDFPKIPNETDLLIPAIKASSLTREELCERLQRRDAKTQVTPEYLDQVLADGDLDPWLKMRLLKALDIPWEDHKRAYDQLEEGWFNTDQDLDEIRRQHEQYIEHGPRLVALVKEDPWKHIHSTEEFLLLIRSVAMRGVQTFDPPSAEAMAFTIANHPEICAHKRAHKQFSIAGYLYYRLPNEVHSFDLQGNLVASGDASLKPPPGLMRLKMRACCGGVRRTTKKIPKRLFHKK